MTRFASLLVGGLFLLHPAAGADQLRLYNFVDDYCNNQPTGGNIDIKKGTCSNDIDSRSFKALINEKHYKWLDNVNKGKERCFLDTFEEANCPADRIRDTLRLPDEIARCYTSNKAIRSVKFRCETIKSTVVTNNRTITDTVVVTSWSLNGNQPLSAITSTKTETHISQFTQAQPARVGTNAVAHGAAEPSPSDMERYPWLYHPWSGSPICYHCRRHSEDDHTNFECRSGPDYPIMCGDIPLARNGDPLTSTVSPTATVTVLIPGAAMGVAERQEIEPRASWHKRVSFEHPFIQGLYVCADAEWEKRGQPHNEIRLQGAKVFNDVSKECQGRQSLDLPNPVVVGGLTTTITRAAPATIGMAASASAKVQKGHDDL